jgi:hypothetical protein
MWNGANCSGTAGTTNPPAPNTDDNNDGDDDGTPPDVVLGDDLVNDDGDKNSDKPDDVLADDLARERGETLPFTGASIIAYLVLALELVGAGFLISRARKRDDS